MLSGQLADYQLLHFVTHGIFDSQHPELSSLLLSTLAPDGRPLDDPLLRVYEIFQLNLAADLVVLSACETALGDKVRGEGLFGLTRGFIDAGAGGVLVSLWRVHDRSTAELMKHFYQRLLEDRLPPARALQAAQITMWRDPRWQAPYFWAGFLLHGDWRVQPSSAGISERFTSSP